MTAPTGTSATSAASAAAPADADFANLVRRELALDDKAELRGKRWLETPPRQLFGIALSGGGIRSATFNLGLLQGLQERGLLRGFDYLATVSGGGYTGAFWTQWRRLHPGQAFPEASPADCAEPHEISHLRRFSRFLSPTLGVFNFDTGRMIIALINAVIPSMIGALSFLTLTLLGTVGIAALVLVVPGVIGTHLLPAWTIGAFDVTTAIGAFLCMLIFGGAHFAAMCSMWRESINLRLVRIAGVVLTLVLATLWALILGANPHFTHDTLALFERLGTCQTNCLNFNVLDPVTWFFALSPALLLMTPPVIAGFIRVADKGHISVIPPWAAIADQVNSWYIFAAAAWAGLTAMWWTAFNLYVWIGADATAVAGATSGIPLVAIVTWLSSKVGHNSRSSESLRERLGRLAIVAAGYVIVAAMSVLVMMAFVHVQNRHWWPWLLAAMTFGVAYVVLFYDPNRVGLHDFYRGRVARGFMGAAHAGGRPTDDSTMEQPEDDVRLANLRGPALDVVGPLHLVVCAANSLTPRERLSSLSRGAESAVLSPAGWCVGNDWTPWPERTPDDETTWKAESPRLSSAVTASGAAFNTQMGAKSIALGPAMSFVMSSLGLRLGLWLRHPSKVTATQSIVRQSQGLTLVEELLGRSDARNGEWVFLSDGGHFDNTGMYELVRRHCRFILVSDCGADTDRAFDDLGSAVRRVREDFGVDIKINLEPLKPNGHGLSRQPMVAGDIHYPNGDTGILLVMKPSLTGNEPPDVLQYRARNAQFPHQSTGDQFFDEAQWESYRRLGLHVARTAFPSSGATVRHPALRTDHVAVLDLEGLSELRLRMARDFGAARREWLARPADYEQRIDRLAGAISSLDALIPRAGALLARQLSWEIPPGAAAQLSSPTPANDYLAALSALRQALVVFESAFLNEQLSANFNQPMYSGVMNVMARWMSAPLMRSWWPLLSSTCGLAFRQFVAAQFSLGTAPALFSVAKTVPDGALELASRHRPHAPSNSQTCTLRLILTLQASDGDAGVSVRSVEVARLDATVSSDNSAMVWEGRDLFVPPGLWGMGFGSRMIANNTADGDGRMHTFTASRQIVLIPSLQSGTPDEKKDSADLQQLYLDAGFVSAPANAFIDDAVASAYTAFVTHRPDRRVELGLPDTLAELHTDSRIAVLMR